MTPKAVIGLGFGDEGKGRVVDELCRTSEGVPRVVRFNGGHQAAHHVVLDEHTDHVFAHFGSGTFRGASTYWSAFCPVSPIALLNERAILVVKTHKRDCGPCPRLVIDPRAPLTTPWDRANNRQGVEMTHGSCGVGIHSTLRREEAGYHLWFEDIFHPLIFKQKLYALGSQYRDYSGLYTNDLGREIDRFESDCLEELPFTSGIELGSALHEFETFPLVPFPGTQMVYEGAQGLMLDAHFGVMPYVTPSRTGTSNLMEMRQFELDLYLVTRAYATRHGNGPFVPFEGKLELKPNPWEQNKDDGPQGKFRTGPLSLDHLRYAVKKDTFIRSFIGDSTLVITCVDQLVEGKYIVTDNGKIREFDSVIAMLLAIKAAVGAKRLLFSNRAYGEFNPL